MRYGRMVVEIVKYLRYFEAFFWEDKRKPSKISGQSVPGRDTTQTRPKYESEYLNC
jgi:hypothetical protein